MSIYLLANIGTRDLQLDTFDDLPQELVNPKTKQLIPRRAGEFLRQPEQLARFLPRLRLPMIEKALRFITPQPGADLRIVLFATNQQEDIAAHYRDGDTIHFAHLIREVLFERHKAGGLAKKQIETRLTDKNPADYDVMYDFYREELPTIARRVGNDEPVYLLIAGGTPQMNTMLLLVGTEAFGAHAHPLYVSQEFDRAHDLDIARQLYRQAFQRSLEVVLAAYAYPSALALLQENAGYLEHERAQLLRAAIGYAIARSNLDLAAAAAAFDTTLSTTRSLRGAMRSFQQEIGEQSEVVLLRETIFLAQIAARVERWSDFLARLHRFSEGCMQLVAEQLGVKWSDPKKRASYAPAWWNDNRALLSGLNLAVPEEPAEPTAENQAREVDRSNLRAIIGALATKPEHEPLRQALAELALVDRPIPLRNNIVHRFSPISKDEVTAKAGANVEELLAAMRRAYRHTFGLIVPDESPYDSINRLCAEILRGAR